MSELLSIRFSHLLRHCSVGSIVRGPKSLMIVLDTSHWTDRNGKTAGRSLRYVERVRLALGIEQELCEPPIAKESTNGKVSGICIPARIFPKWAKCPHCNLLHFLPVIEKDGYMPRCQEQDKTKCLKRPRLGQVPYVLAHRDGYMDDLDWHYLTHSEPKNQKQELCRKDTREQYIRFQSDRRDPAKTWLRCERCKASVQFNRYGLGKKIKSMASQPWISEIVKLEEPPEIIKVNDIGIHLPKTCNALVIPPESRIRKGTVVDRIYNSSQWRRRIEGCKTSLQLRSTIRGIATKFRCEDAEVEVAWEQIKAGYPLFGAPLNLTPGQLFEDEYRALIEEIPDLSDDEDFVTRHYTAGWKELVSDFGMDRQEGRLIRGISRLVAVTRLKEVMAFEGFYRCTREGRMVWPDITGESKWLPAIELFGEGLFITFDECALKEWESLPGVMARAKQVQDRYEAVSQPFQITLSVITPRFMFLHAMAHLLIRQLECNCGYPAASLKERIYCGQGDMQMAGILIYVAVPDIVGSLGGIVEIADPRRFLVLAASALARAEWCSIDPVCSEQEAQGLHLLNRAACHSCLLIPETSCAYQNTLLDRVFVKGDRLNGVPSFFSNPF